MQRKNITEGRENICTQEEEDEEELANGEVDGEMDLRIVLCTLRNPYIPKMSKIGDLKFSVKNLRGTPYRITEKS